MLNLHKGFSAANLVSNSRVAPFTRDQMTQMKKAGFTDVRIPVEVSLMVAGLPTGWGITSDPALVTASKARLVAYVEMMIELDFNVTLCPFVNKDIYTSHSHDLVSIIEYVHAYLTMAMGKYPPDRLGFELVNEPQYSVTEWNLVMPGIFSNLRGMVRNHTILIPPAGFDTIPNLGGLNLINDPNVIYTVHCYQPGYATQGHAVDQSKIFPAPEGTPGSTGQWTMKKFLDYMQPLVTFRDTHKVSVMIGEFGSSSQTPIHNRTAFLDAVIAFAKSNSIPVGVWDFEGRLFGYMPHSLAVDPIMAEAMSKY